MWTLELGLADKFVEVALIARPGHLRVCGRQKSPEGVAFLLRNKYIFRWFRDIR
jgi:hypothetical protein